MKLSEQWLREWVNPNLSGHALIEKLSLSGLAVESYEPIGNDFVFDFELTPNRGDCLSVLGIAREISLITNSTLTIPPISSVSSTIQNNKFIIDILSPDSCPKYAGRIIKNFEANKSTPEIIKKRLEKSGIKIIHPIVDIMNYVMIELGQPMHAFDLNKIDNNKISIRLSKQNEEIILLDNQKIKLDKDTLVIADDKKLLALAGVMGGLDSAVNENTTNIFIESAFFTPNAIAGKARKYGLSTDGAHRFERGVDFELPQKAITRATELLLTIYNNLEISDIFEKVDINYLPKRLPITIRPERVKKLLGLDIKLNNTVYTPPSYRFDITEEVDVIEEIARLHGYDKIPATEINVNIVLESNISLSDIKKKLIYNGYQEVITYSFISEKDQQLFDPQQKGILLSNPLSSELAVMRSNLWAGLINTVLYNLNRQQNYFKFFEQGLRFVGDKQESVLSGVIAGKAYEEQWGESKRDVDFFDLKNNIENLGEFIFESGNHQVLHPGQTAKIMKAGECVGLCGALHPELQQKLDIKIPVFLFEIKLDALIKSKLPSYKSFSKFPAVRRDIALLVENTITSDKLKNIIINTGSEYLMDITIFDVYPAKNSIAVGLLFQAPDRTLLEDEIDKLVNIIINNLKLKTGATLRE